MQNPEKKKLSTESYKGVRDFYPEEMFVENHMFTVMRSAAESFGYVEYNASLLEPSELYRAKSSEEIVSEQTYSFTDRGGREVTLRPEMTPTLARMVAARRKELAFPLRWYSIPNIFRYERPQRGRLREHWQLNCDLFGVPGLEAEVEIIMLASHIMRSFGATDEMFAVRINSRKLLESQLRERLTDPALLPAALRLIDKKNKLPPDAFAAEWAKLSAEPFDISPSADEKLTSLIEALKKQGVCNVAYDPLLARGFDYYTDIVFEVFDTSAENPRSLFGGGRYDNLLDIFGVEPVPAAGFGMGDVTLRDFLETHGLLPDYESTTELYLATVTPSCIGAAQELARFWREKGVAVAVNLLEKKLGDQIKTADRLNIPFMLTVGENEIASGAYKLKHLGTGEEREVTKETLADAIFSFVG